MNPFNSLSEHLIITPIISVVLVPIWVLATFIHWSTITLGQILIMPVMILVMIIGEVTATKMYSDKGLFGKHSCRWLNSSCWKLGKYHNDLEEFLCDNHAEESRRIKEYVRKVSSENRRVSSEEAKRFKESGHRL